MQTIEEIRQSVPEQLFERAMTTREFLVEQGMATRHLLKNGAWRKDRKNCRVQLAWIGDRLLFRVARPVLPHIEHNFVLSAKHLYIVGEKLGIFPHLRCGKGEKKQYWTRCRQNNTKKGHRPMPRLIAESVEALIAVIYLTRGYQRAAEFVTGVVINPYLAATPTS